MTPAKTLVALLLCTLASAGCGDDGGSADEAWTEVFGRDDGIDRALLSVWGRAADDVFVVGGGLGNGLEAFVSHYDGEAWTDVPVGSDTTLWWAWGPGNDNVYFSGENGVILHYDGSEMSTMSTPGDQGDVFGVWGTDDDSAWAVGGSPIDDVGFIWEKDGDSWVDITPQDYADTTVFKVWGTSATDVWFVGVGGLILHYDGTSFTEHSCGSRVTLFTVSGSAPDDVWAVGGPRATVCHYDGTSWSEEDTGLFASIVNGVSVEPNGRVWIVGDNGLKAHREIDGTWVDHTFEAPSGTELHAVWAEVEGEIFAVGGNLLAPRGDDRFGIIGHFGSDAPSAVR